MSKGLEVSEFLETKTGKGWGRDKNLLQPIHIPGLGQEQPGLDGIGYLMGNLPPSRELCFLICSALSPHPDSLRPIGGWPDDLHDDLHTPPKVLPSCCHKEFDSTKETKRQKHVQHDWW